MTSIVSVINDVFADKFLPAKLLVLTIPMYYVVSLFSQGNFQLFSILSLIIGFLFLTILSIGINNVRRNKNEILSLNPIKYLEVAIKLLFILVPYYIIINFIGNKVLKLIVIPNVFQYQYSELIFNVIVWSLLGSIFLTGYLSFSKSLDIKQGYNLKIIFDSCIDVLLNLLFFIPQLIIVDVILMLPVAFILYSFFHLPFNHYIFNIFYSIILVLNISIFSIVLAQIAFEQIKGNNEDYEDNYKLGDENITQKL